MKKRASYFGKRGFDILLALCMLVAAIPLMLIAAIGILISSPGPIFYLSKRAGKDGKPFVLYKLRSMIPSTSGTGSSVTKLDDPRVYPFGAILRKYKIDELPQLINILKGDMSVVGPRPEVVEIVKAHYTLRDLKTLNVRPGLTSPGSIYFYTVLEKRLADDSSEAAYVGRLMPEKLAVEHVYLERESLWYDIRIIFRTAIALIKVTFGRNVSLRPPELDCIDNDDVASGTCDHRRSE